VVKNMVILPWIESVKTKSPNWLATKQIQAENIK